MLTDEQMGEAVAEIVEALEDDGWFTLALQVRDVVADLRAQLAERDATLAAVRDAGGRLRAACLTTYPDTIQTPLPWGWGMVGHGDAKVAVVTCERGGEHYDVFEDPPPAVAEALVGLVAGALAILDATPAAGGRWVSDEVGRLLATVDHLRAQLAEAWLERNDARSTLAAVTAAIDEWAAAQIALDNLRAMTAAARIGEILDAAPPTGDVLGRIEVAVQDRLADVDRVVADLMRGDDDNTGGGA